MNTIWKNFKGKLNAKITSRRSSGNIKTTTATTTYHATADEQYIGVACDKASTIYLPATPADGKVIIIKSEMKPPMSGRKITIATTDGSTIDGYTDATITVSHDCKSFIFHNNNWHIIS